MKILHIVRQFVPMIGGLENYVFNLALTQINQGHQVTVLTLNKNFMTNEKLREFETLTNGIKIIRVPYFFSKRYPVAFSSFKYFKYYDLINVHAVDFFTDFVSITKFLHKKKIVLITHGGFFHSNWGRKRKILFFNIITRFSIRRYNIVIGCSENDIRIFNKIYPNIKLINNGVNVEPYLKIKKCVKMGELLYVGRLDYHKRIDNLLRIVAKLKQKNNTVHLNIVGPDWKNLKNNLEELAKQLDIDENISITSAVSFDKLLHYHSSASVFVSASEYEGFGLSAVEAMAAGTICVLNNIPSFNALLKNMSFGAICNFNKINETADTIYDLFFTSDELYSSLSIESKNYSKKFGWDIVGAEFEKVYEDL